MKYIDDFFKFYCTEIQNALATVDPNTIRKIAQAIDECRLRGGQIYTFGNGGSAGIAAHFSHNLNWDVSSKLIPGEKFAATALNEQTCHISGVANDTHYDQIFVAQLHNYLKINDLVIGISASGNSDNVVEAVKYATTLGCEAITFTGNGGGKLSKYGTINLVIKSKDQQAIEDSQQIIFHTLVRILHYHVNGKSPEKTIDFHDIANLREKEEFLNSRQVKVSPPNLQ